jgi:hypothetical protein
VWDLLVSAGGPSGSEEPLAGDFWALPYTQPGSASYRLFRALHRLGREGVWRLAAVLLAMGVTVGLTALLPTSLRPLTAAALALCLTAALTTRHAGSPPASGQALLTLGLPWLAGHVALAPLTIPSLFAATGFSFALWGYVDLFDTSRQHERRPAPASRGVLRAVLGQAAVGALAAWLRRPWLASGVLALLLPALALWPVLAQGAPPAQRRADRRWYVRWSGIGLLAALPLAAWALAG